MLFSSLCLGGLLAAFGTASPILDLHRSRASVQNITTAKNQVLRREHVEDDVCKLHVRLATSSPFEGKVRFYATARVTTPKQISPDAAEHAYELKGDVYDAPLGLDIYRGNDWPLIITYLGDRGENRDLNKNYLGFNYGADTWLSTDRSRCLMGKWNYQITEDMDCVFRCPIITVDSTVADSTLADSVDADSTLADSAVANSAVANSAVANPAVANPAVPNSAVPNSAVPNSAVPTLKVANSAVATITVTNSAVAAITVTDSAVATSTVTNSAVVTSTVSNKAPAPKLVARRYLAPRKKWEANICTVNVQVQSTDPHDEVWRVFATAKVTLAKLNVPAATEVSFEVRADLRDGKIEMDIHRKSDTTFMVSLVGNDVNHVDNNHIKFTYGLDSWSSKDTRRCKKIKSWKWQENQIIDCTFKCPTDYVEVVQPLPEDDDII